MLAKRSLMTQQVEYNENTEASAHYSFMNSIKLANFAAVLPIGGKKSDLQSQAQKILQDRVVRECKNYHRNN